jgi:hypothetical protein
VALDRVRTDPQVADIARQWQSSPPELAIDFVVPLSDAELADEPAHGIIFYDESAD